MKISELNVDQLAEHAENAFLYEGSSQTTARLLYQALSINLTHVKSLTLSINWIMDLRQPMRLRAIFSAPIVAYLTRPEILMNPQDEASFTMVRTMCLHQWGYSRHKTTGTSARMGDFSDPSLFDIDEDGFAEFVAWSIEPVGSVEQSLVTARTVVGVSGKLLRHKDLGDEVPTQDLFHPDVFVPSPAYQEWLETAQETLPKRKDT